MAADSQAQVPQPRAMPDTSGCNAYTDSPVLAPVLDRWLTASARQWVQPLAAELGAQALGDLDQAAADADRRDPQLHPYDKRGERVDLVEFHPAFHQVSDAAYRRYGLAAMSHREGVLGYPGTVPEVAKQALFWLFAHADRNVITGLAMTDVLTRVLRLHAPEVAGRLLPRLTGTAEPVRCEGRPWQAAMFLTEKAGGSDVGANEMRAERGADGGWRLWGDKWFCSNCQADLFLTLARPAGAAAGTAGLGLFLVLREGPDGTRNGYTINRLKTKLGTRGLASGEITFHGAAGELLGEPPAGFRQMTEMLNQTRVANAVVASAITHRAFLEARAHALGRTAFGRRLADQPLMREVLADLVLAAESSTRLALFTAALLQRGDQGDDRAAALLRVLTPMVKYHTARVCQWAAHESMEVRGGNGYIEDWPNARLVRDAHLLSIWEGSGNIMLLDAARALRAPGRWQMLLDELAWWPAAVRHAELLPLAEQVSAAVRTLAGEVARLPALADRNGDEAQLPWRGLVQRTVDLLAAGLLLADGDDGLRAGDARMATLAGRHLRQMGRTASPGLPVTDVDESLLGPAWPGIVTGAAVPVAASEAVAR
jgi:acyl-CoA dehydrogenase